MRKKPIYMSDSVTYWPGYIVVPGGVMFLAIEALSAFLLALVFVFEENDIWTAVGMLLFFLACIFFILKIKDLGYKKITINQQGVSISEKNKTKDLFISWSDIDEIKYEQQLWYGLESLLITYRKPYALDSVGNTKPHSIRLPLCSVDLDRIKRLVPRSTSFVQ